MEPRIRDFIETKDGLIFSVVSYYHPSDRYLAFLRYYPSEDGEREFKGRRYKKVSSTGDSFRFLQENFPDHIFYSKATKSSLQCVPVESVSKIYYPWRRLGEILEKPRSPYEKKVAKLSEIFAEIPKGKKRDYGLCPSGLTPRNIGYRFRDLRDNKSSEGQGNFEGSHRKWSGRRVVPRRVDERVQKEVS